MTVISEERAQKYRFGEYGKNIEDLDDLKSFLENLEDERQNRFIDARFESAEVVTPQNLCTPRTQRILNSIWKKVNERTGVSTDLANRQQYLNLVLDWLEDAEIVEEVLEPSSDEELESPVVEEELELPSDVELQSASPLEVSSPSEEIDSIEEEGNTSQFSDIPSTEEVENLEEDDPDNQISQEEDVTSGESNQEEDEVQEGEEG